jgi:hypothetical protein
MPTKAAETSTFIRDMVGELAEMADSVDLPFLSYLLRLVEAEARSATETESLPEVSTRSGGD